jgi:hypothetical protein
MFGALIPNAIDLKACGEPLTQTIFRDRTVARWAVSPEEHILNAVPGAMVIAEFSEA